MQMTEEHKRKIGLANLGRKRPDVAVRMRNRVVSEETRRKMSFAKKGGASPMLGKRHSEESKKKIREKRVHQVITEITRKKLSLVAKGRRHSEEHKRHISEAHMGKHLSEEHKKILSDRKLGPLAPNWMGGKSFEPYTPDFNARFKNKIRARDNQICMLCNVHREKLSRALAVHHIDYDKKNSFSQNCISLCTRCHLLTNFNRAHWKTLLQGILMDKYGYSYTSNHVPIIEVTA